MSSFEDEKKDDKEISWSKYLDKNIHYVKYFAYAVGVGGLIYGARSIRLGTRFRSVTEIPEEFFVKQFILNGTVTKASPGFYKNGWGVDFHLVHTPILQAPAVFRKIRNLISNPGVSQQTIRVQLPVVQANPKYLQSIKARVIGKDVTFQLLKKGQDEQGAVACAFILEKEKRYLISKKHDLGAWIVENGYGSVQPVLDSRLSDLDLVKKYFSVLTKLEDKAAAKNKGMWRNSTGNDLSISRSTTRWIGDFIVSIYQRLQRAYKKRL